MTAGRDLHSINARHEVGNRYDLASAPLLGDKEERLAIPRLDGQADAPLVAVVGCGVDVRESRGERRTDLLDGS